VLVPAEDYMGSYTGLLSEGLHAGTCSINKTLCSETNLPARPRAPAVQDHLTPPARNKEEDASDWRMRVQASWGLSRPTGLSCHWWQQIRSFIYRLQLWRTLRVMVWWGQKGTETDRTLCLT
jgi:hypothetical protein